MADTADFLFQLMNGLGSQKYRGNYDPTVMWDTDYYTGAATANNPIASMKRGVLPDKMADTFPENNIVKPEDTTSGKVINPDKDPWDWLKAFHRTESI